VSTPRTIGPHLRWRPHGRLRWLNFAVLLGLSFTLSLTSLEVQSRAQSSSTLIRTTEIAGQVTWAPDHPVNGSPCLFIFRGQTEIRSLQGKWLGHDVYFSHRPGGDTWYGIAGVDQNVTPGTYDLELEAVRADGSSGQLIQPVEVSATTYKSEVLRVPERFVKPTPEMQKRIEEERELKQRVFSQITQAAEWSGSFIAPVDTQVSEPFGTQRVFNGVVKSVHQGLDFHAHPGTPVLAANSGQVVLAGDLFYEGKCVVIDHGQGLFTLYMHLSEIQAKEGLQVKRGQVIGLSGATGRATGPHLHMAVRWEGVYLDPARLLAISMPELQ